MMTEREEFRNMSRHVVGLWRVVRRIPGMPGAVIGALEEARIDLLYYAESNGYEDLAEQLRRPWLMSPKRFERRQAFAVHVNTAPRPEITPEVTLDEKPVTQRYRTLRVVE